MRIERGMRKTRVVIAAEVRQLFPKASSRSTGVGNEDQLPKEQEREGDSLSH